VISLTDKRVRIAVVGTKGQAMRVAIPTIKLSDNADFVGLIGSNFEVTREVADNFGVKAFESAQDLISSSSVDAVWVCVPNSMHTDIAEIYLRGGINVLLEKPMATTSESAQSLLEVNENSTAVLKIAYQHRFRDAHSQIREHVLDGSFGEIGMMRLHRFWKFPYFPNQVVADLSEWRKSPEQSGGWAINDIGCHLIDLMLWISPKPAEFLDGFFTRRFEGVSLDSSAFLRLRTGQTSLISIETSNALESPGSILEIYGEGGWLRSMDSFHDMATNETNFSGSSLFQTSSQDTYLRMLEDFISACHGLPSIGATAKEAFESVLIVEQARIQSKFMEDI
jgi:predicted dehydrogenase